MQDVVKKTAQLGDLATIALGHSFRGAVDTVDTASTGNLAVLQPRDIHPDRAIDWKQVDCIESSGSLTKKHLQSGDILFNARGRLCAVCLEDLPAPAICTQHIFTLRLHDATSVLPAFLAWQLNQPPAQRYFATNSEGSRQLGVRRTILEQTPIVLPSTYHQTLILQAADNLKTQNQLLQQQIKHNQNLQHAIANDWLR